MIHSARAVDTSLAEFVVAAGAPRPTSIGAALAYLRDTGTHGKKLSEPQRLRYQGTIANVRNKFMHEAGKFPNVADIATLLSEMDACLFDVFGLW